MDSTPLNHCIVHAADLHLGAPLESLGRRVAGARADYLRELAATAFDRLIDLVLDQQALALVLAGDVYDDAEREMRAQLRFRRGLDRLAEAAIPVFIVHGNHDPLVVGRRRAARLPDNVTVFDPGQVGVREVELGDGSALSIAGVSFGTQAEHDNLARRFHGLDVDPRRSVGVLHTNLGGTAGHDNYAPCSTDDLMGAPIGYWALGHIHKRTVGQLEPGRWYAYPGNLQGRSAKLTECGPKGALVVPLIDQGFDEPVFHACDAVRFARIDVDLGEATDVYDAMEMVAMRIGVETDRADGRPVVVRVRLVGATAVHGDLAAVDDLTAALRDHCVDVVGDGDIIGSELATRIGVDRGRLLARDDLLSELLATIDVLAEDPEALEQRLAPMDELVRQHLGADVDPLTLLAEAERLLIDHLGAQ